MKLSALADLGSFALLGPGFGDGGITLLSDLRPSEHPQLVYAAFEPAATALCYSAESHRSTELDFDVQPRPISFTLRAEKYHEKVMLVREAIARGDVYQVCHTVRADLPAVAGEEIFALLCSRGVPRFASWVRLPGGEEFVSASPELFFECKGSVIHAEPMKGTAAADAGAFLEESEKERSELTMITDLLRNDLTRVCRPGSVHVACPRRLVELPYAIQCVSDIVGELAEGATPLDALAALHPGGSVTGAPKRAALDMIRTLEPEPRRAYCGALGFCQGNRGTFSLLIRTASKTPSGWVYGVGSGIVYDSDPDLEFDELNVKLGALQCDTPS
jgi:para-aminobenzoate synthetase/4-amino-4-deoxychorismate lyase